MNVFALTVRDMTDARLLCISIKVYARISHRVYQFLKITFGSVLNLNSTRTAVAPNGGGVVIFYTETQKATK